MPGKWEHYEGWRSLNFSNTISSLPKFAFGHKVGNIWPHIKQTGRVFCSLFSRCCYCCCCGFFFLSNSLISCSNFILFFLLGWLFCPVNFYRPDFANCGLIPLEIWDEYLQLLSLHYVFVPLIHTSHKELSAHPKNLSMTCLTYSIFDYYVCCCCCLLLVGFNLQENI